MIMRLGDKYNLEKKIIILKDNEISYFLFINNNSILLKLNVVLMKIFLLKFLKKYLLFL